VMFLCVYEEHREQREKHREKREQRRIERAWESRVELREFYLLLLCLYCL
jgi:hypothetical protein